ncbi:MAG: hypothetical protein K8T20_13400 [Planctomycetes bacterium]|nr:hypothetical protein [Planctomycetota bacterium]
MRLFAAAAIMLSLVSAAARAEEVLTTDGRKLVGTIASEDEERLTVLTYKDGPVEVRLSDVKSRKAGKTLYDDYATKKADFEDTADGHFKLGIWCRDKGLTWQARIEWRKTVELEADNEAARKALGDKKVKDTWTTFEDQQKAKGLEFFEGKWVTPEAIATIRRARHPAQGWVLTATYRGDADEKFLASWGERAKEASQYMWDLTEGQMYVAQITITDNGGPADFTIVNKDLTKAKPGEYYAITLADTIEAPGKILAYTFFHELIHFKYHRPEHCDNCKNCIMSSDPNASLLCDDADHKGPPGKSCWGAIREFHKKDLALLPLTRKAKPGPVPETKVIVNDRVPKK